MGPKRPLTFSGDILEVPEGLLRVHGAVWKQLCCYFMQK